MKWLIMFFLIVVLFCGCDNRKPQVGQVYLFGFNIEDDVAPIRVKIINVHDNKVDYEILGHRIYYGLDWETFKDLACAYCEPI